VKSKTSPGNEEATANPGNQEATTAPVTDAASSSDPSTPAPAPALVSSSTDVPAVAPVEVTTDVPESADKPSSSEGSTPPPPNVATV
jgi:hypothetical protein